MSSFNLTGILPENATAKQIETYNKNMELYKLALAGSKHHGVCIQLVSDLGSQDIWLNKDRFINQYPFHPWWPSLANG